MKKKVLLFVLTATTCLTAGIAMAGFKDDSKALFIYRDTLTSHWWASASLGAIRNNASAVEKASCSIQRRTMSGVDTTPYGSCTFTDSVGTKTCTTSLPSLVRGIESLNGDSHIYVYTNSAGTQCTEITVTTGSQYMPKAP